MGLWGSGYSEERQTQSASPKVVLEDHTQVRASPANGLQGDRKAMPIIPIIPAFGRLGVHSHPWYTVRPSLGYMRPCVKQGEQGMNKRFVPLSGLSLAS